MNKPQGNGLVELVDDREPKESSFFCMDLVGFITQEIGERGVTCAETIFIDGNRQLGTMAWPFRTGQERTMRLSKQLPEMGTDKKMIRTICT